MIGEGKGEQFWGDVQPGGGICEAQVASIPSILFLAQALEDGLDTSGTEENFHIILGGPVIVGQGDQPRELIGVDEKDHSQGIHRLRDLVQGLKYQALWRGCVGKALHIIVGQGRGLLVAHPRASVIASREKLRHESRFQGGKP